MGVITARQGRMRARLIGDTTDATPTDLLVNGQTGLLIEAGVTAAFFVRIVGRAPGGAMVGHYTIEGLISNNAGTTAIQGDLERTTKYEAAAGLQTDALADNTNDALIVRVTGLAATTIHWEADVAIQRSIA
jgi:hypothetical protein